MQPQIPQPVFFNIEYLFANVGTWIANIIKYIFSATFFATLRFWVTLFVILLITSILYSLVRLYEMELAKKKKKPVTTGFVSGTIPASVPSAIETVPTAEGKKNPTWENIRAKLLSENPGEWRLGIIEADIYLDRLLDDKGYHGDTVSDKLKQVVSGDLPSIQLAWEAHKVRNRIAHDGEAFTFTMPEARRALSYFEIVFRDLGVIE